MSYILSGSSQFQNDQQITAPASSSVKFPAITQPDEGVSNGPIQFESARKFWPLLELLAKIR